MFDKEGNGYIGQGEFRYILTTLGEPLSDHEVDELLKDAEITPYVSLPSPRSCRIERLSLLRVDANSNREARDGEKAAV